jgi:hypothetical protein
VPPSTLLTEVGLTLIFASWTLTRRSQRLALERYRHAVAARLAVDGEIVPIWVSMCNVVGWGLAVVAGTWSAIRLFL